MVFCNYYSGSIICNEKHCILLMHLKVNINGTDGKLILIYTLNEIEIDVPNCWKVESQGFYFYLHE
jgi:hypothetical protein